MPYYTTRLLIILAAASVFSSVAHAQTVAPTPSVKSKQHPRPRASRIFQALGRSWAAHRAGTRPTRGAPSRTNFR